MKKKSKTNFEFRLPLKVGGSRKIQPSSMLAFPTEVYT